MNNIIGKIKNFIQSIRHKTVSSNSRKNPWAGLSSYEDPMGEVTPLKFCGREEESLELFRLIDDNLAITLYGKSGIGKTSLLNAGVFPLLRQNNYAPIYVRFILDADSQDSSYANQIIRILDSFLEKSIDSNSIEIVDVIPENKDSNSEDYLWAYFARRRFLGNDGKQIFPVIVLDQFEENIRLNREQASLLLKQIVYMTSRQNMLKDTLVDNELYTYDYNFRFVISIREDDLYRLEDIINTNYLSSLRDCRYRLQNLSNSSAKTIVKNVGMNCIALDDAEDISKHIITIASDKEDGLIQTNIISLVCARLYELVSEKGKSVITLQDVESYLLKKPFEEYYASAVGKLPEGEKRFIEDQLVSGDGRRTLLPEQAIKDSIRSYKNLINGKTPILHRIQSASGECLIELIHDGLCPVVQKYRAVRLEKKNKTILALCLLMVGIVGLWMLNTSIVNGFVRFFLALNSYGIKFVTFFDILSVVQLISIILCPIAVGSMVYDYKRKRVVSLLTLLLYLIPLILYPQTFINLVENGVIQSIHSYNECGVSEMLHTISDKAVVFIVYSIALVTLCSFNFFGKSGINRRDNFIKIIWSLLSVKVYLFIIVFFLFYKSIFNTGYFVVDSFDSSWGLLIVPLLTLNMFGACITYLRNKVALGLYVIILIFLMLSSIFEIFITPHVQLLCIGLAFLILFFVYYRSSVFNAILKSLGNIIILALVMSLQIGYNAFKIENQRISKVYPWKILISENANTYGIYDAIYGDTILIPEFNKDSISPFDYYKIISNNSYIDTISNLSIGYSDIPFPFKLSKIGTGEWKLSLKFSPNYERAISSLAHSGDADSLLSDREGAELFLKLRNDISKFCITGNDSILLSDIPYIISYEETISRDLCQSIELLKANISIMTEEIVVPFIKALSRSLYMNMLKESILKEHYNDFVCWYSNYYIATSLTRATAENGIKWSNNVNYNWNLCLNSNSENTYASSQSSVFSISLDGLNNNEVYAWNNLYYALFLLECNSYAPAYYSGMEKKLNEDYIVLERMGKSASELFEKLSNHHCILKKQTDKLNNVLEHLTSIKDSGEELNAADISKTINAVIEINNISNKIKANISSDVKSSQANIIALSDSLKNIALLQANIQFENIVTNTFSSLLEIISDNPNNAYNGLLISLCQKLYVIGVIREYNMENFSTQMENIERQGTLPMYTFVMQTDRTFKKRTQLMDSIKSQLGINNLKVNQVLEQINNN